MTYIYRDYDDLGLVFLIPTLPIVLSILTLLVIQDNTVFKYTMYTSLVISCLITIYVAYRTYFDNNNIILFFIAFITKIPLGILFVFYLFQLANPSGNTSKSRAKSRGEALIVLALLAPIIGLLVHDKNGILTPQTLLRNKRVGKIRKHLK